MTDRNSVDICAGDRDDDEELPRAKENLTGGMRVEDILGSWPADELDRHEEARRKFRNSALRARNRTLITPDSVEIYTGDRDDVEELPRAKEKLTGGMRVEDIWGRCPPEEFEGFDEWLREFRRRGARKELQQ